MGTEQSRTDAASAEDQQRGASIENVGVVKRTNKKICKFYFFLFFNNK